MTLSRDKRTFRCADGRCKVTVADCMDAGGATTYYPTDTTSGCPVAFPAKCADGSWCAIGA